MTTITHAWNTGRARRAQRINDQRREPLLTQFIALLGRRLPRWSSLRSGMLQMSGIGLVDYAIWQAHATLGLLVTGLSLFIVEWLFRGNAQ